jgi:hypothetical protein
VLRRITGSVSIAAFEAVFREAITIFLKEVLKTGSQTLENVNIISARIVGNILSVKFDGILKEICSMSCKTQQTISQLDDVVKETLTNTIADGSFVQALKKEYQDAINANSTIEASDPLLSFSRLNTTAGAAL